MSSPPARWRACLLVLSFLAACAAQAVTQPASTQPTDRPRVRLVATGGTISNRSGGRLTAQELVASIPGLDRYTRAEFEQFVNLASSELTLEQWLQLARRINDIFNKDAELAGVVVTSGTDTLEEIAYFLHLTVRHDRPVVITGSMRNPNAVGYEGPANLLAAFRTAAESASRGRGALVVLNDEINSARDVTKTDALRLQTFQTRVFGALGTVDNDRVAYSRDMTRRHTAKSEFDVSTIEALPRVDVIMTYQDAPGDLIKAAVDRGARGIVIASAGAGATSGTQNDGIEYALSKKVFIVTSTRTGSGRIAPRRGFGPPSATADDGGRQFRIAADDLAPVKARILLMLALSKTQDPVEVQRIFTEY
ncbi:MAG TPA: asparaginase [Vicinamibacterales bacterium]|nr:asparaginase [Vicinamibacterales bacterium]